jgi:hypothetical protein
VLQKLQKGWIPSRDLPGSSSCLGFKEEGTENEHLMLIFDRLIRLQRSREDVLGLRLGEGLWCSLFLTSSHPPLRSPL